MNINEIKNDYSISLHKLNEDKIGELPLFTLDSLTRRLDDIDEIQLTVFKYYVSQYKKEVKEYCYYDEIKPERLIGLDGELFIIKEVTEALNGYSKVVKAYGYEKKLERNNISVEGVGFMLMDSQEEDLIFSLSDYMYEEIGWRFNHIDNEVRYSNYHIYETNLVPSMRWQDSLDQDWYSFINETIAEQFECIPIFNRRNRTIDLYSIDNVGERLNLILSHDNYIKSLERSTDSSEIVTRLKLQGSENLSIEEHIPTGFSYIENYDYFIGNGEMSIGLINALNIYEEVTNGLMDRWRELKELKVTKETEKTNLENSLYMNLETYKQYAPIRDAYIEKDDAENILLWTSRCNELKEEETQLKIQIKQKQIDLANIENEMREINRQCRRETTTYNGIPVFNNALLNELKKFVYYDTYSNESFYDADELINVGKRILEFKSKPTKDFSIDSKNFIDRLVDNGFRKHWRGHIGLGDVIQLHYSKENKYESLYLVGYSQNFKTKELSLELSNKKTKGDNIKDIATWLKLAKKNDKELAKNIALMKSLRDYTYNLKGWVK